MHNEAVMPHDSIAAAYASLHYETQPALVCNGTSLLGVYVNLQRAILDLDIFQRRVHMPISEIHMPISEIHSPTYAQVKEATASATWEATASATRWGVRK